MEAWRKELYLSHHGIKGMKWGIRRYQNPDGTRTSAGKRRYGVDGLFSKFRQGKHENTAQNDQSPKTNAGSAARKGMSSKTKKVLAATATVAAIGVIGAVALTNPKTKELASTGKKAVESALSGIKRSGSQSSGKWDPDFERNWRAAMEGRLTPEEKRSRRAAEKRRKHTVREQRKQWAKEAKEADKWQKDTVKALTKRIRDMDNADLYKVKQEFAKRDLTEQLQNMDPKTLDAVLAAIGR